MVKIQTAQHQANQIALDRDESMKVMRFASQDAMDKYIAETDEWSMQSIELVVIMNEITEALGSMPYAPDKTEDVSADTTKANIASAKSCSANFLK